MSFNLRNMRSNDGDNGWEHRRELVAKVISRCSPDLIGTQEGYWPQIEYLRNALPDYDCVGVARDDGDCEGETCTIFFRRDELMPQSHGTFWFSETPNVPGSRHWTRHHPRICTLAKFAPEGSLPFTILNVHLDHESQMAREKSVRMILDRCGSNPESGAVIAMGDFNMTPYNPAYLDMTSGASPLFRDTYAMLHSAEINDGTFHDFTGRTDMERIDYIFVSPEFKVESTEILRDNFDGAYPSDHFPIIAGVEL